MRMELGSLYQSLRQVNFFSLGLSHSNGSEGYRILLPIDRIVGVLSQSFHVGLSSFCCHLMQVKIYSFEISRSNVLLGYHILQLIFRIISDLYRSFLVGLNNFCCHPMRIKLPMQFLRSLRQ